MRTDEGVASGTRLTDMLPRGGHGESLAFPAFEFKIANVDLYVLAPTSG